MSSAALSAAERIVRSNAPSIHGHLTVKRALAATLFGGIPKPLPKGHSIQGDMNLLLVGDPGIAKSQFLNYTSKVTPRNVYATGGQLTPLDSRALAQLTQQHKDCSCSSTSHYLQQLYCF